MLCLSGFELYSPCVPPIFDRKLTIRNKIHKRESKLLKQNNKEEKEILPFVTQYQPSVSTILGFHMTSPIQTTEESIASCEFLLSCDIRAP